MAQFKTRWWNDRWFFKNETAQKNSSWKLLCRKGVYPFDYMSDFKKFGETQLPSKEAQWFRYLWRGQRSREEGLKRIWDENDGRLSQSVSSFSLLPLKKIRKNVCLENYDLDPTWYYIAPGLAWDAALKDSLFGANPLWKLELLTCVELLTNVAADRKGIGRRHLNDFKSIRKGK